MKKIYTVLLSGLFLLFMSSSALAVNLTATAHVQNIGDMSATSGTAVKIGTEGQSLRMEAFTLKTDDPNLSVVYSGHVENIGWQNEVRNGETAGTKGESKRIEAFKIRLEGADANKYDIYYRAHVENYGTLDWAKNGEMAGTSQHAFRCESLEITIKDKNAEAPGETEMPMIWAYDRQEGENLFRVNVLRKDNGKHILTGDPDLHRAAQIRANELLVLYSHTRPNGESPTQLARQTSEKLNNYRISENILTGTGGGARDFEIWENSPLHRENMISSTYDRIFSYNVAEGVNDQGKSPALQWFGLDIQAENQAAWDAWENGTY